MIQKLYEELILEVHKFYKDQVFFKALKNYLPEVRKIIIDFFKKKGVTFSTSKYSWDEAEIDYKQYRKPFSAEEVKALKSRGFKKAEIDQLARNKGTLKFDSIVSQIGANLKYDVNQSTPADIKEYFDGLDPQERSTKILEIIKSVKTKSIQSHRKIPKKVEVEPDMFGAQSRRFGADMTFPPMKKDDFSIEVTLKTNEEFFVTGHDMTIELKKEDDKKKYEFKVNLMHKIDEVLNDIWTRIEEAINMMNKGIEQPEKSTSSSSERKRTTPNPVKIVDKYFSKWYSKTKTGKLREVSTDRMPAEIYMVKSGSKGSGDRTFSSNPKNETFEMRIKLKGQKKKLQPVIDAYPNIREWHTALRKLHSEYGSGYMAPELLNIIPGEKIYTDQHDKFYERLKFVIRKLAAEGWYPASSHSDYKQRGGKGETITFKYSDKIKNESNENPDEFTKRLFNSEKFKSNVKDTFYSKGTNLREIPRIFVKKILSLGD